MRTTRTIKFEVVFPDMRRKDLLGSAKGAKRVKKKATDLGLYGQLWAACSDLTRAANKLMSALYQLKLGTLAWPEEPRMSGKDKGKVGPVHLKTLAYRAMNGSWQPFGEPMYVPTTDKPVGSRVLLETSSLVYDRLQTDFNDVRMGKKTLASFRRLPLLVLGAAIQFDPEKQRIYLALWGDPAGGRKRQKPVVVRHRKLDKGQRAILRRIMDPDDPTRHGSAKLAWVQPEGRKGRWMLSLSWTGEVEQASSDKPLIAGVHLGMTTGASIAYVEPNGVVRRRKDLFDLPKQTLRAAQRLRTERRERLRTNRDEFGLREGRGRQRKLRVASAVGEKISRLTDTACKQLAAAVVNQAKECGAVALGLEDLNRWSRDRAMDEAETKGSNRRAAEFRQWYFRWLQGTIRAAIKNAADREGLPVFEVDAAYDSRACHNCDTRYAEPVVKDGVTYGRWKWRGFRCTCGVDTHADRNAAINVARRTHEVWAEAQQEAAK